GRCSCIIVPSPSRPHGTVLKARCSDECNRAGRTEYIRRVPTPRFEARALLRQVLLTTPAASPDGSQVAYVRRTVEGGLYRHRIWLVPWRGGRARPLTGGPNDTQPRWSPEGERLLFLSDRSGRTQPWVLPLAGGEPEQLVEVDGNVAAAEWSPDGRRVL